MLDTHFVLAQGGWGEAILRLVPMAGVVVVPVAIGSWWRWARVGRSKSTLAVGWLVTISALFLIWFAGFVLYWNMPSVDEEMAVEEVESACPSLDSGNWNYSAKHSSPDVWMISVEGQTRAGEPIRKTFRVTPDAVEEKRPGTQSEWVMLKQWPMLGAPSSPPTSRPASQGGY